MKAIVNTGPDRLELLDTPLPEPGPGQVRIRTGACGICATDLLMIHGWQRTGFPSIPGHEWAGTIDATGNGVSSSLVNCRCVAENVWADGGEVGFEHAGGYAQYFVTEAHNIHVLPSPFPLAAAALIEPLAVSVRGVRRLFGLRGQSSDRDDLTSVNIQGPALIFGDGPIGLLMLALLARAGIHNIVLIGGREGRLALAREYGASQTLNYHHLAGNLKDEIYARTQAAFTFVIEATGSGNAMDAAVELAAHDGKVLVVGDYGSHRASFPWNLLLHREIVLIGSNASAGAWPEAVRLAAGGQVPLERLITHRLPARRYNDGIDLTRSRSGEVIKVILEWE